VVGSGVWWAPECGGLRSVVGSGVWWAPECGGLRVVVGSVLSGIYFVTKDYAKNLRSRERY